MMDDDKTIGLPNPRVILIAGGFTGIVCPAIECGCRLDDLMPCGVTDLYRDGTTGIPYGCRPGYIHNDPGGGPDWLASTKKEPPSAEEFDMWRSAI
jgi:hypothetical protein